MHAVARSEVSVGPRSVVRFDAHLEIIPENEGERRGGERQKYSMKFPVKRKLIRMLLRSGAPSFPLSLFLH